MTLATTNEFVRGPGQLRDMMRGFPAPWYVAGGWAIDLFLDEQTRPHKDIEIAVFRRDQAKVRTHLRGWDFVYYNEGQKREWADGRWLAEPLHEIHATRTATQSATELTEVEILLNEERAGDWLFRRDQTVTFEASNIGISTAAGVPVLRPEIVLLYKAKARRDIDDEDFANALPALDDDALIWLGEALESVHPGHAWLDLWKGESDT